MDNAPTDSRRHKSVRRREEILAAAAVVFADQGYRCADVERIAGMAGVGKGTVYRHFTTKEALFLATVEKAMDNLTDHVNDSLETVADPLQQLKLAIHRYFQFFDRNPGTVELFIQERAEFRHNSKPLYFVYQASRRQVWLERFQALARDGRLRDIAPELALDMIGELVYGSVFSHRLAGDPSRLSSRSESVMDVIFHGILRQ
ncbi:MAG: TetR/AcrR family transcriptional regulator [Oleiphilaceae bacterium]|nr:TetR/AcrR family transcriptional regulator [Oleiphilaceae bacterium]